MKPFKILPFIVCIFMVCSANAQKGQVKMNLQYSYALPLGGFKNDVISNGSPRGVTADLMYKINDKFSVGLGAGFQDFYQKYPRSLYKTGGQETTSAVLSNSIQVMPLLAKAEYYPLNKRAPVQPFINAGAGLGISSFTQYLGEFGGTDYGAGFMLQGGAGIFIPFKKYSPTGLRFGANYNMVNYKRNGFSNFDNLNFQAGISFPLK